jgi:membrane-associated phospholipid phosphatase
VTGDRGDLRATWPLHRRQSLQLLGGWAALTVVWIGLGKLLTGPLADGVLVRADERMAHWMVARRTPTWNHVTVWGSYLAETTTKVVVTALLAVLFIRLWRRWFEAAFLIVSLVVEAAAFIVITAVVGRDRPDVLRLDSSPVGSSFPSGHAAAAAAYAAIAVIVFWHTRKRWARALAVILAAIIPVIVGLSRMYRGMHFLSDTIAGVVLGGAAVALTALVLAWAPEGAAIVNSVAGPGDRRPEAVEDLERLRIAV